MKILEKEVERARLVRDHPHLVEQLYQEFMEETLGEVREEDKKGKVIEQSFVNSKV